jgi:hypothetical protein
MLIPCPGLITGKPHCARLDPTIIVPQKEQFMPCSSRRTLHSLVVLLTIATLFTLALTSSTAIRAKTSATSAPAAVTAEEAITQITDPDGVLRFEVAEDGTRFTWNGDPALTDGLPDRDATYITQGYIYPEGTLNGRNGVLADGSPEFPDKVLGQWSCYGWYVGAGKPDQTAPWITSHLFNFGDTYGAATLVSEGYSIDDLDVALERAVVGGTGDYAGARGIQLETNLGHNLSNGLDFLYEVRLVKS